MSSSGYRRRMFSIQRVVFVNGERALAFMAANGTITRRF